MGGGHDSLVRRIAAWGRLTGLALGLVAVILGALFFLENTRYEPRLERAIEAARVLRLSHEAMLDQETGLRGYLLTGDEAFLVPYQRGRRVLTGFDEDATRLLSGSGTNTLLLELRLAQREWQRGWADDALERGRTSSGAAVPAEFLERGKTTFDQYRARYDAIGAELVRIRSGALADEHRALLVALGATFAVLAVAGVWGAVQARRLRQAVARPLDSLLARLAKIRSGDLAPRDVVDGPAELRAIGEGVEATAAALAEARATAAERDRQLEARSRGQAEVLALAREVSGSLSLRYVLRGVCVHSSAVADGARVVVWLFDEPRCALEAVADTAGPDLRPSGTAPVPLGDGAVGKAGQHGRRHDAEGLLAIPMVVGAEVIGVLEFASPTVSRLDRAAVDLLETLAVHAGAAIGAARLHEHTAELAVTDALTGLPNRRRLEADLRAEANAAMRYARPLALLMIDVDHFKSYNDTFGHQAGDAALQAVARVLSHGLRASDVAYRYGGEEFVLILRETTRTDAVVLGERLRSAVEHHFAAPAHPRAVTISIGVAGLPENGPGGDALTRAADEALYAAKLAGRNRVLVAGAADRV